MLPYGDWLFLISIPNQVRIIKISIWVGFGKSGWVGWWWVVKPYQRFQALDLSISHHFYPTKFHPLWTQIGQVSYRYQDDFGDGDKLGW